MVVIPTLYQKLISEYNRKKSRIKERLKEFSNLRNAKDEDIFSELCFCILTPQSKALNCDKAIKNLKRAGLLFKRDKRAIKAKLKGLVRFHNNKAGYLVAAREFFKDGNKTLDIKSKLGTGNVSKTRDWLVKNIKGLGYKEASHFLRNTGIGKDIAILDRHILRDLERYKVLDKIPPSLSSKKNYLSLEGKMRKFAQKMEIPLEELDLLLWSNQTGFIFK